MNITATNHYYCVFKLQWACNILRMMSNFSLLAGDAQNEFISTDNYVSTLLSVEWVILSLSLTEHSIYVSNIKSTYCLCISSQLPYPFHKAGAQFTKCLQWFCMKMPYKISHYIYQAFCRCRLPLFLLYIIILCQIFLLKLPTQFTLIRLRHQIWWIKEVVSSQCQQ